MSRKKVVENNDGGQLVFDFNQPSDTTDMGSTDGRAAAHTDNSFVFPKNMRGISMVDRLASCMGEIMEFLTHYPEDLRTLIFKYYYVLGWPIKEIATLDIPGIKMPSNERIRQIAESIAKTLGKGSRCTELHGARLSKKMLEEIRATKESGCGVYVDASVLKDKNLCRLQGVAYILSMCIVESSTLLPMLTNRFLVSNEKPVKDFRWYYKTLALLMQEEVRPLTRDQVVALLAAQLNGNEVDIRLMDLALADRTIFEVYEGDDGLTYCQLRFEHLKVYQQLARIVYEKKSISCSDIAAEMKARGSEPKSMSMSQTAKKFPWCVPMGRTSWLYKNDGQKMDRVQDVIKEYCEQHVRFTFDEILEYLQSKEYDMLESSIRNYITVYCRPQNADRNCFCLTSMVPPEEEKLWHKKHEPAKRKHNTPYHKELIDIIVKIIKKSPQGYVPRKTLKKQVDYLFEENHVASAIFYKLTQNSDRVKLIEIDGEVCITTVPQSNKKAPKKK